MSIHATAVLAKPKWSQGVLALFFIQIFSTLSFSVLYSTLVLYMADSLHLSTQEGNSIMGVFISFNYALHLLGGYWGGRFLSYRALFCLGMLAQTLGCVFLAQTELSYLYWGLACFLTGSGLNVTCLNCMLTQRFLPKDKRREGAFFYNYAGMNLGFFIGFSISGYFQLHRAYEYLFLFSSVGNVLALVLCIFAWSSLKDLNSSYSRLTLKQQVLRSFLSLALLLLLPCFLLYGLHYASLANRLVLSVGVLMPFLLYYLAQKEKSKVARDKIYAFTLLMLVSIVFWTLFQTSPMGLTYFIAYNVERQWHHLSIPPQWFQNINTLCIISGGPLLSIILTKLRQRGVNVQIPLQFSLALACIGLAFLLLPLGIMFADAQGLVSASWVIFCFILQSIGELLISPVGYAMIGALAPWPLQGIMMGMVMLSSGVGACLASYSSNWMTLGVNTTEAIKTNPGYSQVFLILGLTALASGFFLWIVSPKLKAWMKENED